MNIKWMLFRCTSWEQQSSFYLPINQGGEGQTPCGFALTNKSSIAASIPSCHCLLVLHPISFVPGPRKNLRSDRKIIDKGLVMIFHYLCFPSPYHVFLDCAVKSSDAPLPPLGLKDIELWHSKLPAEYFMCVFPPPSSLPLPKFASLVHIMKS